MSRPVGLWRQFLWQDGAVIDSAWREAKATGRFVGSCRQPRCGGNLKPGDPYMVGQLVWYPARCNACGAEPSAPGPKPAAKTTKSRGGA